MTLKLAETSVAKSRPSVPYGANLLTFILCYSPTRQLRKEGAVDRSK